MTGPHELRRGRRDRSDGGEALGDRAGGLVRGEDGAPLYFISQIQDISDRTAFEDRLEREARTDGLTGVANRLGALDALERIGGDAAKNETGMGICFCDLIGFKSINDELGHEAGDRVLQVVAGRLADSARPGDVVARWGGDEFIVILADVDAEDAVRVVAARPPPALIRPAPDTSIRWSARSCRMCGPTPGARTPDGRRRVRRRCR